MTVGCESRSTRYWLKHVQGARALLDLRGKDQVHNELGRRFFEALRTQILSHCSLTRSSVPNNVTQLSRECQIYECSPANSLTLIAAKFLALRAERPFHPPFSDSALIDQDDVRRCARLLVELDVWKTSLPPEFSPTSVQVTSRADVLGHCYDVYRDPRTTDTLNHFRRLVILTHELAINRLLKIQRKGFLSNSQPSLIQELRQAILLNVNAVCASVPFFLESRSVGAGLSLLWSLYVSAQLNGKIVALDHTTIVWIIGRLRNIGVEMGIRQAMFLADVLDKRQEITEYFTSTNCNNNSLE